MARRVSLGEDDAVARLGEKWRRGDAVRRNSNERETARNASGGGHNAREKQEKLRLRCKSLSSRRRRQNTSASIVSFPSQIMLRNSLLQSVWKCRPYVGR